MFPFSAYGAAGSVHAGLARPATVRPQRFARSRRFAPRNPLRACFIPVTLMGFRLQGLVLPREARTPLGAGCSRVVRPTVTRPTFRRTGTRRATSEPSSSRRVVPRGPKPAVAVALLTFCPSRDLRAHGVGEGLFRARRDLRRFRPGRATPIFRPEQPGDPPLTPVRFSPSSTIACATASCGACAPECCPPRELAFPRCRGAGPPGVPHLIASSEPCDPCDPFR